MNSVIDDYQRDFKLAFTSFFQNRIDDAVNLVIEKLESNQVFVIGNGGSAAIAQHFATDWSKGLYGLNKKKSNVISLTTNSSILTAIGNDLNFEEIYSHQIEIQGKEGDLLVAISSSGNSRNILEAIRSAQKNKMVTIGLSGFNGGELSKLVDNAVVVHSNNMQVIEDVHGIFGHLVYKYVESHGLIETKQ
jgi:D-sedoheptulose 7-phosphate isomerase